MITRKSGILALVVGAAVLGACESKDSDIVIEPPPQTVTVTIAPKPVPNLNAGQTQQLVAVVTGTSNAAVTWSVLSGTSATVSATGLVTASATVQGVTTIQAASVADPNAKDVVTVTVGGAGGGGAVAVTIGAITQFGTIFPVNPGNTFGIIDITANLDVPTGTSGSIRVDIVDAAGNAVRSDVCRQDFTSGSSADAAVEAQIPVTVVCTFNTAQLDSAGLALLQNNTYRFRVRVLNAAGTTQLASAISQPYIFNNQDMLIMVVRTDSMSGPQADQAGLSWRGGNVTVHIRPAIFSTTQASPLGAITSMNINLSTSGAGSHWRANCSADNDLDLIPDDVDPTPACGVVTSTVAAARQGTSNLWRASFPTTSTIGVAGSGGVEDRGGLVVSPGATLTVSGNNFAGGFVVNFPTATPGTVPVPIGGANPLRVDNFAPRVTSFNITGAFLGCGTATCFGNPNFSFAQGAIVGGVAGQATPAGTSTAGYTNVDFGVDRQTSNFAVGTAAQFTAGSGFATGVTTLGAASPALTETTVSTACPPATPNCIPGFVARVTVADALGNDTIVYAGTLGFDTLLVAGAQTLGFDRTAPVINLFTFAGSKTYADNSVDQDDVPMTVTVQFLDTASTLNAGPAGFPPGTGAIIAAVTRYNATDPVAGTAITPVGLVCGPLGPIASACTYTIPDATSATTAGYFVSTTQVRDATVPGGNLSAVTTRTYLDDETAPAVAGVTAPSQIPGNTPQTFTADMSDNVELGDALWTVGYMQGGFAHTPRAALATYGLPLTSTATGSVTYNPFIYSLESTAAGLPIGDQAFAQSVNVATRDMAGMVLKAVCPPFGAADNTSTAIDSLADGSLDGWCLHRQNNNVAVNIAFANPPAASFTTLQPTMTSWTIDSVRNAATPAPVTAGYNTLPSTGGTVTIRATAQGPQGTFINPFEFVNFYAFDNLLNRWLILPGTPTVVASDADVVGVRVWRFTLVVPATSWPIENFCGYGAIAAPCAQSISGTPVIAIGVSLGRGLLTNAALMTP